MATVTGVRARAFPSSILTAAAVPSGSANASTPSAPGLEQQPGDLGHQPVLVPGGAGRPGGELAHRIGDLPLRGARLGQHQGPERPGDAAQGQREHRGAAAVHPDRRDRLPGQVLDGPPDVHLERVVGLQVGLGRPLVGDAGREHGRVLARAVVPDPRLRPGCPRPTAAVISRRAVGSSPGSDAGQRRSSSVSPAKSRMSFTPWTWKSSPEWLAAASASSSPSSGSPARSIATACSGLLDERGKTGALAMPAVNANVPSAASATMVPRCRDSTNPDRITSASTGLAATSPTDNCSKGVTRTLWPLRSPHLPILAR